LCCLTPCAITYWIFYDGYFDKGSGRIILSTDNFSLEEIGLLISIFEDYYDLHPKNSFPVAE